MKPPQLKENSVYVGKTRGPRRRIITLHGVDGSEVIYETVARPGIRRYAKRQTFLEWAVEEVSRVVVETRGFLLLVWHHAALCWRGHCSRLPDVMTPPPSKAEANTVGTAHLERPGVYRLLRKGDPEQPQPRLIGLEADWGD